MKAGNRLFLFLPDRSLSSFFKYYRLKTLIRRNVILEQFIFCWSPFKITKVNGVRIQLGTVTVMRLPEYNGTGLSVFDGKTINEMRFFVSAFSFLIIKIPEQCVVHIYRFLLIGIAFSDKG